MSQKLLVAWNINPALHPAAEWATKNIFVQVIFLSNSQEFYLKYQANQQIWSCIPSLKKIWRLRKKGYQDKHQLGPSTNSGSPLEAQKRTSWNLRKLIHQNIKIYINCGLNCWQKAGGSVASQLKVFPGSPGWAAKHLTAEKHRTWLKQKIQTHLSHSKPF